MISKIDAVVCLQIEENEKVNVFEIVKQSVSAKQAAEHYGIAVKRNGMACCPFHNDKNPSMKIDQRFYCFGCGIKGDVIDLVAGLFGIGKYDAAIKLAKDFGLTYETRQRTYKKKSEMGKGPPETLPILRAESVEEKFERSLKQCIRILSDYLHLLKKWKRDYAPKLTAEEWHPLFCEALQQILYVEYLLDILLFGEMEDIVAVIVCYGRQVMKLEKRIGEFEAGNNGGSEMDNGGDGTGEERGRNTADAGGDTKGWCEEQYKKLPDDISA